MDGRIPAVNYLQANYQWIIASVLVPILAILIKWLLNRSSKVGANSITQSPKITVAPTLTQSPNITVAPIFNVSQATATRDESVAKSPHAIAHIEDATERSAPELRSLEPRISFVDGDGDGFTEVGKSYRAVLATFRMVKPSSDRRGTSITARLAYKNSTAETQEFCRIDYGTWIDEDFNSVAFTLADTKELVLVLESQGRIVAVSDRRYSVAKRKDPKFFEIKSDVFFVNLTLVDEVFGPLITYTYKIETEPLKVSEIIRIPR